MAWRIIEALEMAQFNIPRLTYNVLSCSERKRGHSVIALKNQSENTKEAKINSFPHRMVDRERRPLLLSASSFYAVFLKYFSVSVSLAPCGRCQCPIYICKSCSLRLSVTGQVLRQFWVSSCENTLPAVNIFPHEYCLLHEPKVFFLYF